MKKEYKRPKITVIELQDEVALMAGSNENVVMSQKATSVKFTELELIIKCFTVIICGKQL